MKVKEIIKFGEKSKIKAGDAVDNGKYVFFTSSENEDKKYNEYSIDGENIIMGTGGNATLHYYNGKCAVSTDCLIIKCNNDVRTRYLYYFFKKNINILQDGFKGAGLKHTNKEYIGNIEIKNIHLLNEQDNIIYILDALNEIMKLYESQLKHFDNLVKSRFVEMFDNNKYEEVNISEVVIDKPSNGFFAKREEYDDNGNVKILGVVNVVNTMYSKIENLPKTNAKQSDIEKYVIKYGDILFCRSSLVAEGIGKASVVPQNVENNTLFECHVIRLKLDLKKVIPEYLQVLTTTNYFRSQILTSAKTATMTTIGQDGIMKCNIKLPPLSVQKEFYNFVKQVDKSKFVVQKALEKTKMLMDSLMQEYFG